MADHLDAEFRSPAGPKRLGVIAALCLAALALLTAPSAKKSVPADACHALDELRDGTRDASPSFDACVESKVAGAVVALMPGRYVLTAPVVLDRPITIRTRGVGRLAPSCGIGDRQCATLIIRPRQNAIAPGDMPVTVDSTRVTLDHIIFTGGSNATLCLDPTRRPSAGGLRASGDNFALTASALTGFACYTALEYTRGARGRVERNIFADNGNHANLMMWSDGLTIHSADQLRVVHNSFLDNTDVQLIFGGCTGCIVAHNSFRHTDAASGGSFAELMIQAWPKVTTGRYDGTRIIGNDIDCGLQRRCGFGLMIGSTPWYEAPTSGGMVTGNRIANAILPLNIDGLTGQMTVSANRIFGRPAGTVSSSCGPIDVGGLVNISPASRPFFRGDVAAITGASARTFKGCLLNPS